MKFTILKFFINQTLNLCKKRGLFVKKKEFKINIGNMTEDAVQAKVEEIFASDFVFRSPRKEGGREVTDVLVLFDDVGIIIQVKARAVDTLNYNSYTKLDWVIKNLTKATRQVSGAVRAIRGDRVQYIENSRRGRIEFRKEKYPWLYGLVILHHRSQPYDPIDLVPITSSIGVPLHVFSFQDLWNLSRYLDTPADMINYFEHRTDILIPTLHPKVHEEEKVFYYYLRHLEKIYEIRAKSRGSDYSARDFIPYAQELRKIVGGTCPNKKTGLIIDHMIKRIHDNDPSFATIDVGGKITNNNETYIRITTELNSIPRVRRIALGREYLNIAKLAADTEKMHFKLTHSPHRSDCMLFMASPLPRSKRDKRSKELLAMTMLAKDYCQVYRAIGVATEPIGLMGSSYDFVFIETPPSHDPCAQTLGNEIFGNSCDRLIEI
jgi:hypothetical protein